MNSSVLSFSYKGKNYTGDKKTKVAIPIYKPSDKYFCIDITELSPSEQGEIFAEFNAIQKEYSDKLEALMERYDIKHAYRYFFHDSMEDLCEETLD